MSIPLSPTSHIFGVFSFLNAALSPEQNGYARQWNETMKRSDWLTDPLTQIVNTIKHSFALQNRQSGVRRELAPYRLYYRDDMADALAKAYCLHLQARNPADALSADYIVPAHGILRWADMDEERAEAESTKSFAPWRHFASHYDKGDRLLTYDTPSSKGYILVRGDRRVWEIESLHLCILGVSGLWRTKYNRFLALGGNRAFLAGEFSWPAEEPEQFPEEEMMPTERFRPFGTESS